MSKRSIDLTSLIRLPSDLENAEAYRQSQAQGIEASQQQIAASKTAQAATQQAMDIAGQQAQRAQQDWVQKQRGEDLAHSADTIRTAHQYRLNAPETQYMISTDPLLQAHGVAGYKPYPSPDQEGLPENQQDWMAIDAEGDPIDAGRHVYDPMTHTVSDTHGKGFDSYGKPVAADSGPLLLRASDRQKLLQYQGAQGKPQLTGEGPKDDMGYATPTYDYNVPGVPNTAAQQSSAESAAARYYANQARLSGVAMKAENMNTFLAGLRQSYRGMEKWETNPLLEPYMNQVWATAADASKKDPNPYTVLAAVTNKMNSTPGFKEALSDSQFPPAVQFTRRDARSRGIDPDTNQPIPGWKPPAGSQAGAAAATDAANLVQGPKRGVSLTQDQQIEAGEKARKQARQQQAQNDADKANVLKWQESMIGGFRRRLAANPNDIEGSIKGALGDVGNQLYGDSQKKMAEAFLREYALGPAQKPPAPGQATAVTPSQGGQVDGGRTAPAAARGIGAPRAAKGGLYRRSAKGGVEGTTWDTNGLPDSEIQARKSFGNSPDYTAPVAAPIRRPKPASAASPATKVATVAKGGVNKGKFDKVMHEWGTGALHSGSKSGPVVHSQKQAEAIAFSESGGAAKGGVTSVPYSTSVGVPGSPSKPLSWAKSGGAVRGKGLRIR